MSVYADTSFLVPLYIREIHSPEARRLIALAPAVWLTPLHCAELAHAVERHVFSGEMSPDEAREVHADFRRDRANGMWVEVSLPESTFETCAELAVLHAARLGTRTLDALHVASALGLKAERFWTLDERQEKLAKAAGLKVR